MQSIPLLFWPIFSSVLSFSLVICILPSIREISIAKNFDYPDDGKYGGLPQLTMGGVALFIALVLTSIFASIPFQFQKLNILIAAMIILFFTGFISDCDLRFKYLRFVSKIIAALLIVYFGEIGINHRLSLLPDWINKIIQMGIMLGFMYFYHLFSQKRLRYYFISGLIGSIVCGFLFISKEDFPYAVVAFALSGSILGTLSYAEYCVIKKKPVARLGHTGIYMTSIVLATLFLELTSY